ncbi:sec1 family domain-containing protein 2 isoform X2 [Eurytemora carolleeae]|uniref:sec1 family domain-containing protein 2 isoform X2 n=1 Tax=Eurytemora carolleeae TaxID=1294199 RepID=UPI000C771F41|nr:sec1 family domain-containing protein 2 isoform X2 [Eurytemora carolleeae]|eukprot:XP_023349833.1 sec1 family domain-containing protein 2-like isoform X2 [Eurytemora affinis]
MSTSMELVDVSRVYWKEIAKKCNKAVVFIENSAAESLHWCGGLALLKNAAHVKEFSSFEFAPTDQKKAVFIVGNPALRSSERTVKNIIQNSDLEYCILITWCQPNVLSMSKFPNRDFNVDDKSGLAWLEDNLLDWMGNRNYTAEVFYYPIFFCSPCKESFYTPSYLPLFPLLHDDVTKCVAYWKVFNPGQPLPSSESGNWSLYPDELKTEIRRLVTNFHSLFGTLGLKEDIWSLGPFSKCIGDQLESWLPARNRRKTAQGSVSLILVDRTLDLGGTVVSFVDSMLGRILDCHEKLEGHTLEVWSITISKSTNNDVCVNLNHLLGISNPDIFVPSSLAHPGAAEDSMEREEFRELVYGSEKELLVQLHQNLGKSSPKKSDSAKKKILNVQGLENDLKEYEGDLESILSNLGSISRGQAFINTASNQNILKRKRLQSLASQFGPDLRDNRDGVLTQISDLVLGRADSKLSLVDLIQLLVYIYSVHHIQEKFREDEEERIKSVLGEAILTEGRADNLDPILQALFKRENEEEMNELVALNIVNYIWSRLEGIQAYRSTLHSYLTLLDEDGNYYGILQQLLEDIYHPNSIEIPDLFHHTGGLGSMIRSSLSWFGAGSNKQHPRQNPWIIVYVVGGITPGEMKELQKTVLGTESKLTIAGSGILTAADSLNLIFSNNPLLTDR